MARRKVRARRKWTFEGLSNEQWQELAMGPFGRMGEDGFNCIHGCVPPFRQHEGDCEHSHFASEEDRRDAWWATREVYMERKAGFRPWAWWRYEADRECPADMDEERRVLEQMGELGAAELAQLAAWDRTDRRMREEPVMDRNERDE